MLRRLSIGLVAFAIAITPLPTKSQDAIEAWDKILKTGCSRRSPIKTTQSQENNAKSETGFIQKSHTESR